jgi:hypothetical protein
VVLVCAAGNDGGVVEEKVGGRRDQFDEVALETRAVEDAAGVDKGLGGADPAGAAAIANPRTPLAGVDVPAIREIAAKERETGSRRNGNGSGCVSDGVGVLCKKAEKCTVEDNVASGVRGRKDQGVVNIGIGLRVAICGEGRDEGEENWHGTREALNLSNE